MVAVNYFFQIENLSFCAVKLMMLLENDDELERVCLFLELSFSDFQNESESKSQVFKWNFLFSKSPRSMKVERLFCALCSLWFVCERVFICVQKIH